MNDDGHSTERHQDDTDHTDHQETRGEATAPPRLQQILLSTSLGKVWRAVPAPGEVTVAVDGVAAAEEKLGFSDVLQAGGVVNTLGATPGGGGEARH